MNKLLATTSALAVLATLGSAGAADMPVKAPPAAPSPVWSWSGFYLGVTGGGSVGESAMTQNAIFASPVLGANGLLNGSGRFAMPGAVFGGEIGHNWQLSSSWVVGLEADWQWTSQKTGSSNCTPAATLNFFGAGANGFGYCLSSEQKLADFGTARARAGTVINDSLWYVTGGAAWGTVKDSYAFAGSATPAVFPPPFQAGPFLPGAAAFSTTRTGWVVGAGVETRLGGGWTAKLEYLHVDLGSIGETFGIAINPIFGPAFAGVAPAATASRVTDDIVRVGVNYRFFPEAPAAFALTADAARPLYKAPAAPSPVWSWSGFYLGVTGGGSVGVNATTQSALFTSPVLGANGLLNSSGQLALPGAVFGGEIGYNWQPSPFWVVGLEADWQWTSQKAGAGNCTPAAATVAFFGAGANGFGYCLSSEQKLADFGTARARTGAVINDSLWYVTGGAAWGTVKDSYAFAGSATPAVFPPALQPGPFLPSAAAFSTTRIGWVAGAGVETKLGGGWTAKLEYLHVDFGTVSETFGIAINPIFGPAFAGVATATTATRVTDNVIRVGANYRFDWGAPAAVVTKY